MKKGSLPDHSPARLDMIGVGRTTTMTAQRATADELDRLRRIDTTCERFEQAWRRGERPVIEDELAAADPDDRPALLTELVQLEWTYRLKQGDSFGQVEYQKRFAGQEAVLER